MKRIFRNSALSIIALAATVIMMPAQAQSWGQPNTGAWRGGATQQQASWDRNGAHNRRDANKGYDRGNRRDHDYRGGYVTSGTYVTPAYGYYDGSYGYRETRDGRSAAIIGGSAAAGALIGAAAGHGQGAVVGAVVGGIAGLIADQAVRHHDYR